ncbi:hypothetical protein BHM03_00021457 [Ensete ventricosum]|nr:hypothetical protein BHM03_00021457 [Ensete ventricosum]
MTIVDLSDHGSQSKSDVFILPCASSINRSLLIFSTPLTGDEGDRGEWFYFSEDAVAVFLEFLEALPTQADSEDCGVRCPTLPQQVVSPAPDFTSPSPFSSLYILKLTNCAFMVPLLLLLLQADFNCKQADFEGSSLSLCEHENRDCKLCYSAGKIRMATGVPAAREGPDSSSIFWGRVPPFMAAATGTSNDPNPSTPYRGVMLLPDGHWGAQIYAHGHRVWLGSFESERAAAGAYDSAAVKLQHGDYSHRNLSATLHAAHERRFQETFSIDDVLDMIRDGSYCSRLEEYIRLQAAPIRGLPHARASANVTFLEMFVKELTPSDVGKLNRLVIPKKHATQYFPSVVAETADEVQVEFVDREDRPWTFRYCYWKSSQSYVFTKGWNKFVKEKRLQAKDAVAFYRCEENDGHRRTYCLIDIIRHNGGGDRSCGSSRSSSGVIRLGLGFKRKVEKLDEEDHRSSGFSRSKSRAMGVGLDLSLERVTEKEDDEGSAVPRKSPETQDKNKGLKLFGVWIADENDRRGNNMGTYY